MNVGSYLIVSITSMNDKALRFNRLTLYQSTEMKFVTCIVTTYYYLRS